MNDYKELIKELQAHAGWAEANIYGVPIMLPDYLKQAADAIEQLVKERDAAIATIPHKCWSCGKGYHTENGFECEETWYKGNNSNCLSWEWRGVTE